MVAKFNDRCAILYLDCVKKYTYVLVYYSKTHISNIIHDYGS